jgi:small subunit ribosomal protein S1
MSEENMNMEDFSKAVDESFETFKDEGQMAWEKLKQYREEKTPLTVTVDGVVNKGVVSYVEGIRGFIPASRLALGHVADLNEYLGKEIQVQVADLDEEKNRLILSARELLRAKAEEEKKARIAAVAVGTVMDGTVETLQPYGAFVKLENGLTGLVHVSQISHTRIKDPSVVLKVGDPVKVKVIAIKEGKLSLSMKALEEDRAAAEEAELHNVKLPKSEELTTSLGDLFKNLKLQ